MGMPARIFGGTVDTSRIIPEAQERTLALLTRPGLWYDFRSLQVDIMDDNTITIIEGPPPVFEQIEDGWALGLSEGPYLMATALTRLRTFNGPALVERCHRAWRHRASMHLVYRNDMGLQEQVPILAARTMETPEGQVLVLWLQMDSEKMELELDAGDDLDDDTDLPGN
jgi:hypothetical protein